MLELIKIRRLAIFCAIGNLAVGSHLKDCANATSTPSIGLCKSGVMQITEIRHDQVGNDLMNGKHKRSDVTFTSG